MPESSRMEAERDLTPEGFALALPLLLEIADLEVRWIAEVDDELYTQWRAKLEEVQVIYAEHYAGAGHRPRTRADRDLDLQADNQ